MKNFENVELPQDKFGLHQTCTIYCEVIALSMAYLVVLLNKSSEELLWKNAEPDSRSLRYICAFQPPRDGSAQLCLIWSGCWFSFGNEFGSPGFTSSWECNRKKTHVRHCLLYEFRLGLTAADAYRNLCSVLGEDGP